MEKVKRYNIFLVWYNMVMVTNPLIHRVMKVKNKAKVFHSSGYARAQSGENFGATGGSGESFKARQKIEEKRRFVRGYNNAKIMNEAYAFERVRQYVPRTGRCETGTGAAGSQGARGVAQTGEMRSSVSTMRTGVTPRRKI